MPLTVSDILGTIRDNASDMYVNRVPEYTKNNIAEVGKAIMTDPLIKNEFVTTLIDKVALMHISSKMFRNPLNILKRSEGVPLGNSIEEIYINPATDVGWESDGNTLLKTTTPDVKVAYYKMNRKGKYPLTLSDMMLTKAFQSEQNYMEFYNNAIISLYSGDEIDEFILMKKLVANVADEGAVHIINSDLADTKSLIKGISNISKNMTFPTTSLCGYNLLNKEEIDAGRLKPVTTWTPLKNQCILMRADVETEINFEVLANIFNLELAEIKAKTILVDKFPSEKVDIYAMLADENCFQVRDYNNTPIIKSFENGSVLEMNYWLHHWQSYDFSMFGNAVIFGKMKETV